MWYRILPSMENLFLQACVYRCLRNMSGKRKAKTTPLARDSSTFCPNPPSHSLHHLFANIQSQSTSPHLPGNITFEAHKLIEKVRKLIWRNTRACIFHLDTEQCCGFARLGSIAIWSSTDENLSTCRCIFKGIGKQITEHLAEILFIRQHNKLFSDIQ